MCFNLPFMQEEFKEFDPSFRSSQLCEISVVDFVWTFFPDLHLAYLYLFGNSSVRTIHIFLIVLAAPLES